VGHKEAAVPTEEFGAVTGIRRASQFRRIPLRAGHIMIDITRRRLGEPPQQVAEVAEAESADRTVQELPRRDVAFQRKRPGEPPPEQVMNHASSVLQRVAVASVSEIESLIVELERLRDFLRQEGVRIQREIEGYARLSEEATKSTKIIAESVAQWKNSLEHISDRRM
jgi:hypothetical protein